MKQIDLLQVISAEDLMLEACDAYMERSREIGFKEGGLQLLLKADVMVSNLKKRFKGNPRLDEIIEAYLKHCAQGTLLSRYRYF